MILDGPPHSTAGTLMLARAADVVILPAGLALDDLQPTRIMRSTSGAAFKACSTEPNRSTAITGSTSCCRRLACQLKLVPREISRSAIFTLQPAFAYSRAMR